MPFRVEVGRRYTAKDAVYLQYPASGATHTIKLGDAIGATTYTEDTTAEGIRDTLEDHLKTVHAGFTVTQGTALTYTVTHSSTAFDLHFGTYQSLADFLGFATSTQTGTSVTSNSAPSIFEGVRGCVVTAGFRWQLRTTGVNHGEARSVKLLKQDVYRVQVQVTRSELKEWYEVQRYMLQGHPFTLYQEIDTGSVNGYNMNYFGAARVSGRIHMVLDTSSMQIAESQVTSPYLSDVVVQFDGIAETTSGGTVSLS